MSAEMKATQFQESVDELDLLAIENQNDVQDQGAEVATDKALRYSPDAKDFLSSFIENFNPCLVVTSDLSKLAMKEVQSDTAEKRTVLWVEPSEPVREVQVSEVPMLQNAKLKSGWNVEASLVKDPKSPHAYLGTIVMNEMFVPLVEFIEAKEGSEGCDYIRFGYERFNANSYAGSIKDVDLEGNGKKLSALKAIMTEQGTVVEMVEEKNHDHLEAINPYHIALRKNTELHETRRAFTKVHVALNMIEKNYGEIDPLKFSNTELIGIYGATDSGIPKSTPKTLTRDWIRIKDSLLHYKALGVTNRDDLIMLSTMRSLRLPYGETNITALSAQERIDISKHDTDIAYKELERREKWVNEKYNVEDDLEYFEYFFKHIPDVRKEVLSRMTEPEKITADTMTESLEEAEDTPVTQDDKEPAQLLSTLGADDAISEVFGEFDASKEYISTEIGRLIGKDSSYRRSVRVKDIEVNSGSISHITTSIVSIEISKNDGGLGAVIMGKPESLQQDKKELCRVWIDPRLGTVEVKADGFSTESVKKLIEHILSDEHEVLIEKRNEHKDEVAGEDRQQEEPVKNKAYFVLSNGESTPYGSGKELKEDMPDRKAARIHGRLYRKHLRKYRKEEKARKKIAYARHIQDKRGFRRKVTRHVSHAYGPNTRRKMVADMYEGKKMPEIFVKHEEKWRACLKDDYLERQKELYK